MVQSNIDNIKRATTGGGSGTHTPSDTIAYDSVSMRSDSQSVDIQRSCKENTPRASTPNFMLEESSLNRFSIFDGAVADIDTDGFCFLQRSEFRSTASGASSEDVSVRGDATEAQNARQGDLLGSSSPTPSTTTMTSETVPNIPDMDALENQVFSCYYSAHF